MDSPRREDRPGSEPQGAAPSADAGGLRADRRAEPIIATLPVFTGFLITAVEEARSRLRDWDGDANHPGLLIQPGRSPWRGAAAPEG